MLFAMTARMNDCWILHIKRWGMYTQINVFLSEFCALWQWPSIWSFLSPDHFLYSSFSAKRLEPECEAHHDLTIEHCWRVCDNSEKRTLDDYQWAPVWVSQVSDHQKAHSCQLKRINSAWGLWMASSKCPSCAIQSVTLRLDNVMHSSHKLLTSAKLWSHSGRWHHPWVLSKVFW